MTLLAFGINHNSAPLEIREKFVFAPEAVGDALMQICRLPQVNEAVILSTCNRSELFLDVDQANLAIENIRHWLANYHGLAIKQLEQVAFAHLEMDAVKHLYRVACGLDSLILGEPQILGQLKSAYAVARAHGSVSQGLNRLFPQAFSIAKQVRTQTAIGENPVSVAFAAVHLSTRIFSDLSQNTALLVGAGETIDLVAKHLKDKKIKNIIIANRTLTRAQQLASQFDAKAILLSDIPAYLPQADIVITSTASQLPLLGKGAVEKALKARRHQPMFMVDIAVPRDIEEEVAQLADVFLYTVDDLKGVIENNIRNRQEAALEANDIIEQGIEKFAHSVNALAAVDSIKAFREHITDIREEELQRAIAQLQAGNDAQQVLQQFAHRLTNKFMHQPSTQLKQASVEGNKSIQAALHQLFQIQK